MIEGFCPLSASSIVELHYASTEPIQSDGISKSSNIRHVLTAISLYNCIFMSKGRVVCVLYPRNNFNSETWTNPDHSLPLVIPAGLIASFIDENWPSYGVLDYLHAMSLILERARVMGNSYRVYPQDHTAKSLYIP